MAIIERLSVMLGLVMLAAMTVSAPFILFR
jgi:hypothetical protein